MTALQIIGIVIFLVAVFGYLNYRFIGLPLPLLHCLLFGALISPTDPIALALTLGKLARRLLNP